MVGITAGVSASEWTAELYIDNLTDEDYATLRADFGWGPQLHWGYKRLMRAEFNLYF